MKLINVTKLTLYIIILTARVITISSSNILIIWLCLELNLFSFIPILIKNNSNSETEASLTYFLAQTLGSTMFLFRRTMTLMTHLLIEWNKVIIVISIILKLGIAPCHHWYPIVIEIIRWINCFILSGWQKLAPLFILIYFIAPNIKKIIPTMLLILSINAITGGLLGLNQTSLKKIIAYSSITHARWILRGLIINTPDLSVTYLFLYILTTFPLFFTFNSINSDKVNDLWNDHKLNNCLIIIICFILISLAGVPPITGFIPKLLILNRLIEHSTILRISLITGSVINLFFYTNICLNMLIRNQLVPIKGYKKSIIRLNTVIALNLLGFFILAT